MLTSPDANAPSRKLNSSFGYDIADAVVERFRRKMWRRQIRASRYAHAQTDAVMVHLAMTVTTMFGFYCCLGAINGLMACWIALIQILVVSLWAPWRTSLAHGLLVGLVLWVGLESWAPILIGPGALFVGLWVNTNTYVRFRSRWYSSGVPSRPLSVFEILTRAVFATPTLMVLFERKIRQSRATSTKR